MKLTIHRNGDKPIGYHIGDTLGTGHNDALLVDCCSRTYRQITDIDSDVEEVREQARIFINKLLDETPNT